MADPKPETGPKPNPSNRYYNKFRRDLDDVSDKILIVVNRELKKGKTPAQAASIAIRTTGAKAAIREGILDAMVAAATISSVGVAVSDELALREWFLNKHFDGVTLSQRIADLNLQDVIANEIRTGLRLAKAWQGVARRLTKKNLIQADVGGYMDDLVVAARRAYAHAGDKAAFTAYRASVRKAKRNIGRLKTGRLAAAYGNIVKKAEAGAGAALAKGIDRAVRAKAAYNAERIARTEIARAYGQGRFARINADPDIDALKWQLSSAHNVTDICDFHAELDAYGMGPGVYPKHHFPAYPAHPHCILPGNDVWIPGELSVAYKSLYNGGCIEIRTSSGRKLSVTKNHPILTGVGWVLAQDVAQGDRLLCCSATKRPPSSIYPYKQQRPTAIENVFASCKVSPFVASVGVPSAPQNFYGDGRCINGKVDIIRPNGFLLDHGKTAHTEHPCERGFDWTYPNSGALSPNSGIGKDFDSFLLSSYGVVSRLRDSLVSFSGTVKPVEGIDGILNSSALDAMLNQSALDDAPANPKAFAQFLFRYSADVFADDVVEIRKFDYSGHVYDLQVDPYSVYTCNGAIVKNCTCLIVPVWVAPPATRFDTDAPKEVLDSKSQADQKAMLGNAGAAKYAKNPRGWRQQLKNWNGHHDTAKGGIPKRLQGG